MSPQERAGPRAAQAATGGQASDLRAEVERLQARVEQMDREREALLAGCRLVDEALGDNELLRAENRSLRSQRRRLEEAVVQLQERIDRETTRRAELEARIQGFEAESRRVAREYLAVAEENSSLAN